MQVPARKHSSLSCCTVCGHYAAPEARYTWLPDQVNKLCLKPGMLAWERGHAAEQQTCKTDTAWHGVWDKANGDEVPKTWQIYSVYRGCSLHFPTLPRRIRVFIYTKEIVVHLAEETLWKWVTIKSSPHHLFFNPINYLQVCNTEIICSTWKQ